MTRGHAVLHYTTHVILLVPHNDLTYSAGKSKLHGYSDASWETKHSTSGWLVLCLWQTAGPPPSPGARGSRRA